MPPGYKRLTGALPTYQPFPLPPELFITPRPIEEGIVKYSSTGMTIMGYRPKRPSEIIDIISEQYEEREVDHFGRPVRGGKGTRKSKNFFIAHMKWYGISYYEDDTLQDLEKRLVDAMTERPSPVFPPEIYELEAEMRERFLDIAAAEEARTKERLIERGETIHTSELLVELTGGTVLTQEFIDNPCMFFQKHFPENAPPERLLVLMSLDRAFEEELYKWAYEVGVWVENVYTYRGDGKFEGRLSDFVLGREREEVWAKAEEMRSDVMVFWKGGIQKPGLADQKLSSQSEQKSKLEEKRVNIVDSESRLTTAGTDHVTTQYFRCSWMPTVTVSQIKEIGAAQPLISQMSRRYIRLSNPPTYQPFPAPPEPPVIPQPIQDGIYSYSSTGFSLMGYRPKRPSELLAAISEQYEEKEYYRSGEEKRGGRGKKKDKKFFKAHLTWYGIEYGEDDSRQDLEDKLQEAMSARPPPRLPQGIYDIEAVMRQRWLSASEERNREVAERLQREGHTIYNSDLFADLTGATSLTDQFFDNPGAFFRTHFPPTAPPNHVVVLMNVDTLDEVGVWEWACDVYKMRVEKVENTKGRGFNRGRYAEFVIGRDIRSVKAKAEEIKRENEAARGRFMPY